jgi:hypothetical protein
MRFIKLILCTFLALAPLSAAVGQEDLASKIVNDPAAPALNGAKGKLIDDSAVQGGKALRVTVAKKGANNWDSVVESAILKPVKAGDRLVIAFNARLEKGEGGATAAAIPYVAVQLKAAPYTGIVSGQAAIGPEWAFHKIEGKADKDYPAGALKATIQIGNAKQVIDLGPIVVLNLGQAAAP